MAWKHKPLVTSDAQRRGHLLVPLRVKGRYDASTSRLCGDGGVQLKANTADGTADAIWPGELRNTKQTVVVQQTALKRQ